MLSKWNTWVYSDNHNCWDYVREYLIEVAKIPSEDVPKFGICPKDKRSMTIAARNVSANFIESGPVRFAVACHYYGKTLFHVGIIDHGKVLHTGSQKGTVIESIDKFERQAKTKFMIHRALCQR
jgi:hypothetical protein